LRDSLVEVENIHKWFGKNHVLKGISFRMKEGEVKVLFGPSGSGKSTILRCINGLVQPDEGKIYFHDEEITSPKVNMNKVRMKMGMVFQHFNLFDHLTALDNVEIGLRVVKNMDKKEAQERAMDALKKVHMENCCSQYPSQLSGGQKQRTGIARALAMDPDVILFDEPTSALDPELIGEVLDVMLDLAKEKTTMIVVTHEMGFARSVSTDMLFIDDGQIIEQGSPEHFFAAPETDRVKKFLSKISDLYGTKKNAQKDIGTDSCA
jgi:polar amino acid transport system ATP-binding protein